MAFDPDWRRLSRWCLLGAIVMGIWLLAPTVKCSWVAFRDTPIGEVDEDSPGDADKERVEQGTGFFDRWGVAIKGCYKQTPPLDQESWKVFLFFGFAGVSLVGRLIHRYEASKKRTLGS